MARGDPPMRLEDIRVYFRGGRYAILATRRRLRSDPAVVAFADRYVAMADRYTEAATQTYRLKRERERGQ